MTTIKRPMLAASATEEDIKDALRRKGELWISPKIDGVRGLVLDGKLFSRSMKPIPNRALNDDMAKLWDWADGELTVGPPASPTAFQDTSGALRRADGRNPIWYSTFDNPRWPDLPYAERFASLEEFQTQVPGLYAFALEPSVSRTWEDVQQAEDLYVKEWGYEGLILRDPAAPYKQGRSTIREAGMLKLKRFVDAEAVVIGAEELLHNTNPISESELGLSKRSSHKSGKVAGGVLGALVVRHKETGVEFKIGTGFDEKARRTLWEAHQRGEIAGKVAKFKSFPVGVKEAPRHPSFLGFREPWDMDPSG